MVILSLFLACTSQKTPTVDGKQSFYGTVPPQKLGAPDFKALNYDGSTRGKEDLIGHPTVIWFYPHSGTPG